MTNDNGKLSTPSMWYGTTTQREFELKWYVNDSRRDIAVTIEWHQSN
jgi:hypothetical protein